MGTEIKRIRGATEEEVKEKKFNIYIGISLGNKWFSRENVKTYITWALEYTKERVAVLIADTLHAINYEVRNSDSPARALRRALKKGDEMQSLVQDIVNELPEEQQGLVDIVRWNAIEENERHQKSNLILQEEFKNSPEFREWVLRIVRKAIPQPADREYTGEEVEKLARYVLNELPELLHGFYYKGTYYNLYPYPHSTLIAEFAEKIQEKKIFPFLYDKFPTEKNIVVELEVKGV